MLSKFFLHFRCVQRMCQPVPAKWTPSLLAQMTLLFSLGGMFLGHGACAKSHRGHSGSSSDLFSYHSRSFSPPRQTWIGSTGVGVNISPGQLLVSPQLEYVNSERMFIGPLVQLGMSSGVLFAASAALRYFIGNDPQVRPCLEAGVGFIAASVSFASSFGFLLHGGIGLDYRISRSVYVGSLIRANIAPPLGFYVAWPIVIGRFIL